MSDFIIPQMPKWGTPSWVRYQMAIQEGIKAMEAAKQQRESETAELERIYRLTPR